MLLKKEETKIIMSWYNIANYEGEEGLNKKEIELKTKLVEMGK